jgi:hypothetical protein
MPGVAIACQGNARRFHFTTCGKRIGRRRSGLAGVQFVSDAQRFARFVVR